MRMPVASLGADTGLAEGVGQLLHRLRTDAQLLRLHCELAEILDRPLGMRSNLVERDDDRADRASNGHSARADFLQRLAEQATVAGHLFKLTVQHAASSVDQLQ